MSATNHTTNYNLPIYIAKDKPKYLTDFNNAMQTIDTAIKGVADTIPDDVTEQLATTKQIANTAKSTADTAKTTADTAKITADTAKSTATQNENVLSTFFEGFTNWQNWRPNE